MISCRSTRCGIRSYAGPRTDEPYKGVFVLEHDGADTNGRSQPTRRTQKVLTRPSGLDAEGFVPIPRWEDPADEEAPRKRMKLFHDSWDACRQGIEARSPLFRVGRADTHLRKWSDEPTMPRWTT